MMSLIGRITSISRFFIPPRFGECGAAIAERAVAASTITGSSSCGAAARRASTCRRRCTPAGSLDAKAGFVEFKFKRSVLNQIRRSRSPKRTPAAGAGIAAMPS